MALIPTKLQQRELDMVGLRNVPNLLVVAYKRKDIPPLLSSFAGIGIQALHLQSCSILLMVLPTLRVVPRSLMLCALLSLGVADLT